MTPRSRPELQEKRAPPPASPAPAEPRGSAAPAQATPGCLQAPGPSRPRPSSAPASPGPAATPSPRPARGPALRSGTYPPGRGGRRRLWRAGPRSALPKVRGGREAGGRRGRPR
ncbi:unnamed protein product, partial [Bubo scandiacus]